MNSASVLNGASGGTIRITAVVATRLMAAKSLIGSKPRFLFTTPTTLWPLEVNMICEPSAGPLAMLLTPAMPGRFSTMTCCFHLAASFSATVRARMSVMLPPENGTTMRTSWVG